MTMSPMPVKEDVVTEMIVSVSRPYCFAILSCCAWPRLRRCRAIRIIYTSDTATIPISSETARYLALPNLTTIAFQLTEIFP